MRMPRGRAAPLAEPPAGSQQGGRASWPGLIGPSVSGAWLAEDGEPCHPAPAYEGPDWPALLLVCAQYPVHGVVGGVCWKCGPRGKLIPLALAAIHIATAVYALLWGPKLWAGESAPTPAAGRRPRRPVRPARAGAHGTRRSRRCRGTGCRGARLWSAFGPVLTNENLALTGRESIELCRPRNPDTSTLG